MHRTRQLIFHGAERQGPSPIAIHHVHLRVFQEAPRKATKKTGRGLGVKCYTHTKLDDIGL